MIVIGIDYSMTSPAICIGKVVNKQIQYENCIFYAFKQAKRHESFDNIILNDYPPYTTDIERFNNLAKWSLHNIEVYHNVIHIFIEGYAYGAVGSKIFQIAENTGIMKKLLHDKEYAMTIIPPTQIKKFATGKGNANKSVVYDSFIEETGCDIRKILSPKSTKGIGNPTSDIVDSYYIAKTGFDAIRKKHLVF